MNAILIAFHCKSNAGYAMNTLLPVFIEMANKLVKSDNDIHVSFTKLNGSNCDNTPNYCNNFIEFDPATNEKSELLEIEKYVKKNNIDVVFGFDQPVSRPSYKYLRRGGVKKIISYWGAPMSSINTGLKLKLKQLQVALTLNSPDHYIFESEAMAQSAYLGRGIPKNKVSIAYLGVNTEKFKPTNTENFYSHEAFNIAKDRRILFYSGHMETRKGVGVLVNAAKHLYNHHNKRDFHFLILGNRGDEDKQYLEMLTDDGARDHVTFGGYRNDIEKIIPACYLGIIASTGWDSFTMSSLEMASSGLPLLVSNLQGLAETIDEGKTGHTFEPGKHIELSELIFSMLNNYEIRNHMGKNARKRILSKFTVQIQIERLVTLVMQTTT